MSGDLYFIDEASNFPVGLLGHLDWRGLWIANPGNRDNRRKKRNRRLHPMFSQPRQRQARGFRRHVRNMKAKSK